MAGQDLKSIMSHFERKGVHTSMKWMLQAEIGFIELNDIRPTFGSNIQTTIDLELQMHCEKLMIDKKGVILLGESQTGGILAAVFSRLSS